MTPTIALQWVGAVVLAITIIIIAVIIIRLLWTALSRQWTKYNKINSRVKSLEHALFGDQSTYTGHYVVYQDHGTRYRLQDSAIYQKTDKYEWQIKDLQKRNKELTQRVQELESYRPTTIANPDDLK